MPLVLSLLLAACTGSDGSTDTGAGDTDTDTDTADTDVTPVWTAYSVGTSSTLDGVYASGEGVYVLGTGDKAYVGGAGVDWVDMSPTLPEEDLTGLWGEGAGDTIHLVVSATSGNVATYTPGGWTIDDLGTSNFVEVGGSGPDALFAVSWGGVFAFDGTTWTFESIPNNENLNDVYGVGTEAIAVGKDGVAIRRASGGGWTAMEVPGVTADLNGVAGTSMTDVWAVGGDGVAIHWDGTAWSAVPTGVTQALWAVFAPAADSVYAVGDNGVAIHYDGTAWTSLPTGVANNLYAVHGATATNVWAVGNRGIAIQYKSTN